MAKPKKKVEENSKSNRKAEEILTTSNEPSASASEALSRKDFWKEEIAALQGQSFEDLDQALECIIDKAVTRIAPNRESSAELKAFLTTVMQTDQSILEILKTSLRIKRA